MIDRVSLQPPIIDININRPIRHPQMFVIDIHRHVPHRTMVYVHQVLPDLEGQNRRESVRHRCFRPDQVHCQPIVIGHRRRPLPVVVLQARTIIIRLRRRHIPHRPIMVEHVKQPENLTVYSFFIIIFKKNL